MKKCFLFIFCALCYFIPSAQNSWGLMSSLNLDKISGDGMTNSFGAGYSAGAYAHIQLTKRLGIQPAFLFSQKNVSASPDFKNIFPESASNNFKTAVSINYISIPVLLNYKINSSWSFNLGPQYSYLLDTDEKLLTGNTQAFKGRDLSMMAGAELKISALKLYGQYSYGLQNLNNINSGQRGWYSRGLQFGIGWRLSR